ncbi:MAG: hypothetical protein GY874_18690 [Desulfobacteraceae bacterium]|nr:hypothetical protein [Desulfobacteraceae bacterium]
MVGQHKHIQARPLFAFTAAAGIFPGAANTEQFWEKIVRAEPAELTPMDQRWGLHRDVYHSPEPGIPNRIYLDKAFCLPEQKEKNGSQIRYGIEVLKTLSENILTHEKGFSFSQTALVLGTSWSDQGYFANDLDFYFNAKKSFDKRFSPDEQLKDLAECIGAGGPAVSVDTACASSLYAVEIAVSLIESGQADSAVILGLNVVIPPFLMSGFSQLMALSPEGKCLPFSRHASGMAPGEAVAAVFLEPLENALASGREILGVLCAAGLSSDGSEGSVFAPGPTGQKNAYQRAYRGINPPEVDYIEAHGTATALGDKIEVQGIHDFFSPHLKKNKKIFAGSVKSLVGHSLAAAGLSSLIKALLMLQHKTIPPHIDTPPSPILDNKCVALAQEPIALDTKKRPARIGVSAFGFGGSNAHLVIESYDVRFHGTGEKRQKQDSVFPDIAIVDFEGGFGNRLSLCDLEPDFWTDGNAAAFPDDRFGGALKHRMRGYFLPDRITIEGKRLKFGSKILTRIDAFQNHAVDLVNSLIKRNAAVIDADDAAITMTTNVGGARSFQIVRKYYADYVLGGKAVKKEKLPETTLEDIGSTLGSMFSGYPAYHFNLKGFHQTCAGDTHTFWTTLLTAQVLLRNHCRTLIAGAGHMIKTPVDLDDRRLKGENPPLLIEGSAVFLLKRMPAAKADGDRVLATIEAIVPFSRADSFKKACKVAGIEPDALDIKAFSQVRPEFDTHRQPGRRFLGEATGCEVLLSVLLKKGKRAVIEVYDGPQPCFRVFIKKHAEQLMEPRKIEIPVSICVNHQISYLKKSFGPRSAAMTADGLAAAEPAARVVENKAPCANGSDMMDIFLAWHGATSSAVHRFLNTQARLLSMKRDAPSLQQGAPHRQQRRWTNSVQGRAHCVLSNISQRSSAEQPQKFSAALNVDESHPYFFDHPLDHVPGILILHGALELYTIAAKQLSANDFFVSSIAIDFKKICEKTMPIVIELSFSQTDPAKLLECQCNVVQNNRSTATLSIEAKPVQTGKRPLEFKSEKTAQAYHDPAVLHKHKAKNVLVSEYTTKDGYLFFDLITPPPGHVLCCDNRGIYSMLYILEVTRQCGMIILHKISKIALDTPMILMSLTFCLDRPAFGGGALQISHALAGNNISGNSAMGSMDFSLHDSTGVIGSSTISTLIVN